MSTLSSSKDPVYHIEPFIMGGVALAASSLALCIITYFCTDLGSCLKIPNSIFFIFGLIPASYLIHKGLKKISPTETKFSVLKMPCALALLVTSVLITVSLFFAGNLGNFTIGMVSIPYSLLFISGAIPASFILISGIDQKKNQQSKASSALKESAEKPQISKSLTNSSSTSPQKKSKKKKRKKRNQNIESSDPQKGESSKNSHSFMVSRKSRGSEEVDPRSLGPLPRSFLTEECLNDLSGELGWRTGRRYLEPKFEDWLRDYARSKKDPIKGKSRENDSDIEFIKKYKT